MGFRAGDIRKLSWYNKELDPLAELDLTLFITPRGTGGIVEAASTLNGNGTLHTTGTRKPAGFDGGAFSCDWTNDLPGWLQSKQSLGVPGPFLVQLIDGTQYRGDLVPEGQIAASTQAGSMTCAGRGVKLEKV